jgi:hypothetical protein
MKGSMMSDLPDVLEALLRSAIVQSPVLLVWLVGAVVALARLPRHPGVSSLVLIALGLALAISLVSAVLYAWLPHVLHEGPLRDIRPELLFGAVGLATCAVHAIAWALILVAAFAWRDGSRGHAWGARSIEEASPFAG